MKYRRTSLFSRAYLFAYRSNQRAARYGISERLTREEVMAITGPCAYCGGEAAGWDHVEAMVLGGPNTVANLVPACWPCNKAKAHTEQVEAATRAMMSRPTLYGRYSCGHAVKPRWRGKCYVCVRNAQKAPA